ncbi:MAG: 2-succinyl-5-enolpyruvyl-6-hydroxy-3-cyclohexene-1-carboxylate synthase, partial [Longispora sp.]|nr:2-succinyl-5-enolpyruvyl-6-hydroxy-3-cyclohexene-1-carboxylate synthase [Longispora sp. (in: high G+C Gram-positive bacteria)]
ADHSPGLVAYWRSLAARTAAVTDGPTHLNVALREPLIPDGDETWIEPMSGRPDGMPWIQAEHMAVRPSTIDSVERGAVVVGDGTSPENAAAALRLAEAAGWPVLSEPTGNARRGSNAIATYPLLLGNRDFAAAQRPDLVVTVGKPTLSRTLLGWLRSARRLIVVDPHDNWADPTRSADLVLPTVPMLTGSPTRDSAWLQSWWDADAAATKAISEVLDADGTLSEPRLARDLYATLPDGAMLFAGTSRPIRDLDNFSQPRDGLRVIGNRGVSGIDGLISTAIGAALVHDGPAYALIGDLAYLHDRNGLVIGPEEARPDLTIVVVDNDGGGIFSLLPQAGIDGFERVFGTPHGVDIARDCAAVGVPFTEVTEPDAFAEVLEPASGLRVVRIRTRRTETAALHARLSEAVSGALG